MKEHLNLSAYNNIEDLKNFTEEQFCNYCDDKLASCEKHLHFINNLTLPKNFNICEIGSGNSKLLYQLELHKKINKGIGIEISQSRYNFAEKFKSYVKSQKVENINKNIFDVTPDEKFDLIIAVDIVLQLITPISDDAESKLMTWIYQNLKEDGYIILELWSFSSILKKLSLTENSLCTWEEFPASDPFKYILSNISLDKDNNISWKKKFIKKDSYEESVFNNILKPYTKEQMSNLLSKYGFKNIEIFDFWKEKNDCIQDEYIIIAKKQG